jgi:hypothetical protein
MSPVDRSSTSLSADAIIDWRFILPLTSLNGLAERTEVLHGTKDVVDAQIRFFSNTKEKIDTCMNDLSGW